MLLWRCSVHREHGCQAVVCCVLPLRQLPSRTRCSYVPGVCCTLSSTAQRGTALTPCVDVQVAWIAADSFKFTAGEDTVKHFQKDKEGNGIVRSFCTNCGTRVRNSMPTKPELCGFFPNLVDVSEDRTAAFAGVWKPQFHWLHTEAVVELAKLEDGIARK